MKPKHVCLTVLIVALLAVVLPAQGQDVASDLMGRINALRVGLGLHPYQLNSALTAAAQNQATWMANTGQISHTQSDGSRPVDRAVAAGYGSTWVSENIYMGTNATAASAWEWWLNSPIHYQGITSDHNYDIGIASASGSSGTAFVLVFGNPGGAAPAARSNNAANSAGASGPPEQPPYVVGLDSHGNIMHEIQPDDTLGDIALIYGYTWDDLDEIRALNNLTEEQGRLLKIGEILLIPPHDGTYTPTPGDVLSPSGEVTAPPEETESVMDLGIIATPTPTPTVTPAGIETLAALPEWLQQTESAPIPTVSSYLVMTVTPTPTDSVPLVPTTPLLAVAAAGTPAVGLIEPASVRFVVVEKDDSPSPLLIAAVGLQVVLIGIAAFEFWRRNNR